MSDISEIKEKDIPIKDEISVLEEDDEFEEFPPEVWNDNYEEEEKNVWEDNWGDEILEPDFNQLLSEEKEKLQDKDTEMS